MVGRGQLDHGWRCCIWAGPWKEVDLTFVNGGRQGERRDFQHVAAAFENQPLI